MDMGSVNLLMTALGMVLYSSNELPIQFWTILWSISTPFSIAIYVFAVTSHLALAGADIIIGISVLSFLICLVWLYVWKTSHSTVSERTATNEHMNGAAGWRVDGGTFVFILGSQSGVHKMCEYVSATQNMPVACIVDSMWHVLVLLAGMKLLIRASLWLAQTIAERTRE